MDEERKYQPLAEKMRPNSLSDVVGQADVIGEGKILNVDLDSDSLKSMILWGPPGVGKTTISRIIARQSGARFVELSAVSSGKADVKSAIESAKDFLRLNQRTILFIDEIHRFNKAQQDYLLPFVEDGTIILIGATTENPSFEVISALMSRVGLVVLKPLDKKDILKIVDRSKQHLRGREVSEDGAEWIARISGGDGRRALNLLELSVTLSKKLIDEKTVKKAAEQMSLKYDKGGDEHYNTISAFIKSMRGSDVDAALFYLHRMLESGEDPKFIARRLVIFASEDIGMASPHALTLAVSVFQAIERVGMPEANYILSHGVVAMAKSKKSRQVADAMQKAKSAVRDNPHMQVPLHIRNAPTEMMKNLGYGDGYEWNADFKHEKGFMPEELKNHKFYRD